MKILSHRGYWKSPGEKNSAEAMRRSFKHGFGTETDLRDHAKRLVISHDPASADAMAADELFDIHRQYDQSLTLALNVKADGLQGLLRIVLERFKLPDAFVFDMSVPDMVQWLKLGVPVFTRHSDVEHNPVLYEQASGIWLDGFHSDWWDVGTIDHHMENGKRVCIVSPELHGRNHQAAWELLHTSSYSSNDSVMLCTDLPEQARALFSHEN